MDKKGLSIERALLIAGYLFFLAVSFAKFSPAQERPLNKEEDKEKADLIELVKLDSSIKLDIRYATSDNFVGKPVYPEARAFLQRPAAEAVVKVHRILRKQGLGLVIFDGYRPWTITKLFWDVVSLDQRKFVADPAKGSKHNRGCAVDLSIYDLKTGALLDMPSGYDEFTERASPDYKGGTELQTKNRELLRRLMEAEGFTVNPNEWWHFDFKGWQDFGLYDVPFAKIRDVGELDGTVVSHVYFSGNETTRDRTIREKVFLREGDDFDIENLYKSVREVNKLKIFFPLTEQDISWSIDKEKKEANFVFHFKEKKRKNISPKIKEDEIKDAEIKENANWKNFFTATGVSGGIYIFDLKKNKFTIYDRERFDTGFVPASTSKIFHSLIFLESGAVKDENEIIKWDGVKRWVPEWNQDHSLKTALKASAAWFYVEASKRTGREIMQKYYDAANYGNRSTDGFGEDYWVKGKLRVTPRQQIEFLVKFYENRLPFSPRVTALVKDLLVYEKTDKYIIRGKTGWSQDFDPWVGWWIGYVERGEDVYFFATELDMKKNEDAQKRYEITKRVLRSLKIIE